MAPWRGWARNLLIIGLLLAGFALKGVLVAAPAAPTRVAAGQFDSARARARLQRILGDQRPHPVDSDADDAVRGRILAELQAIGLPARIQDSMDCSAMPRDRLVSCSHVRNVLATVPARGPGPQLLLNAHYDSTPTGPGAADDGIGVATLLEVGAMLKAQPPARPVTLLFNEGEEFGLNGAAAFARSDPLARSVNSLINIEARGVSGPAIMFETSDPNGPALHAFAAASLHPHANSLSTDFARLIPNTTDVVKFRPLGWTMLNFAIIGNETRYHSPGDTVAALDPRSLAHMGSEVLAATRTLAATRDPARAGAGRTVFTDVGGRWLFALPLGVAATALGLLLLAALVLAWRRRALGKPLAIAAGVTASGIAAAAAVTLLAGAIRPGDFYRATPLVTYLGGYAVLLLAMAAAWARWGRRVAPAAMRSACWLLILLAGSAASIALPGATIFFLAAPAVGLIACTIPPARPRVIALVASAATLIQFVMFAQMMALIEILLIDGPLWAPAPLAALAVLPAIIATDAARLRPALGLLVVAAAGLWGAALTLPRASGERPQSFSIDYFRDAARGHANWAIATKQAPLPAALPGRWHAGVLPYNGRTRWIADAPLLPAPVPQARVIGSEPAGNGRLVRIRLSAGGGNALAIRFAENVPVIALGLPGSPVRLPASGEPRKATLRCSGRSCEGLVIEALVASRKPAQAELFSIRFALPPQGAALLAARPRTAIPQYAPDQTITRTVVRL